MSNQETYIGGGVTVTHPQPDVFLANKGDEREGEIDIKWSSNNISARGWFNSKDYELMLGVHFNGVYCGNIKGNVRNGPGGVQLYFQSPDSGGSVSFYWEGKNELLARFSLHAPGQDPISGQEKVAEW